MIKNDASAHHPLVNEVLAPLDPMTGIPPGASPGSTAASADRLRQMFDLHFDFIWRLLRRSGLSGARAEDAAQEVFIVASQKLDAIAFGSERSFLFGTALRVASTVRRSAEYRREHVDAKEDVRLHEEPDHERASSEDLVDQRKAREALDTILASMEEDFRLVFVLFELEGVSMAEIAELLAIPPGTVASRLRRAREVFQTKVDARFPKRMRAEQA